MIGWYGNVGYIKPEITDYKQIKTLDDFIFTDIKRPYVIFEANFIEGDQILNQNLTRAQASALALQFFGDQIYSTYMLPLRGYNEEKMDYYNEFLPSYNKGYPNLWGYAKESGSSAYVRSVIYFPTLKKGVFIFSKTSLNTNRYFTVNDNNVSFGTTQQHNSLLTFDLTTSSQPFGFDLDLPFVSGYKKGDDISERVWYARFVLNNRTEDDASQFNIYGSNPWPDMFEFLFANAPEPDIDVNVPSNPYEPGGSSGEGGGNGTFDGESENISLPTLPSLSSSNTGFTRIYNPSLAQVQDLARYLWTDDTVIETIWNKIKQFFENPMNAIIGFNLVPVPVPSGGTENFKLMYIDTGVSMTVAANQFVDVDCGDLKIEKYYGSALDYSPNTKISCFLPFIGNVSLNVDEVMDKNLNIIYRVDICSGSCVAHILVDGNDMYQYSGHCAISIPLSGADFSSYVNAAISVGKLAGAALISGAGVAASVIIGDAEPQTNKITTTTQITDTTMDRFTGEQVISGTKSIMKTVEKPNEQSSTQASFLGISPRNISNTVGQVISSKPHIEHSGSFSGNSGYLGVRRPFVIIERPNMCMPENYQHLNGFPSMITALLGSCKGYTVVQQVQLTELYATNPEQAEILELLKSGVIL